MLVMGSRGVTTLMDDVMVAAAMDAPTADEEP